MFSIGTYLVLGLLLFARVIALWYAVAYAMPVLLLLWILNILLRINNVG